MTYTAVDLSSSWAFVGAVIGVVSGLIGIADFVQRRRRRKFVSWKEIEGYVTDVLRQVRRDKFDPDIIVGVGRGGMIVASMIAANYPGRRVPLAFLDTEPVKVDGVQRCGIRNPESLPSLAGKRVLLVVAELFKGLDLAAAEEHVGTHAPSSIRTLSLLVGEASIVRPDFAAKQVNGNPMAPWRITEEARDPDVRT